jgi:hypothetical protein
MLRDAPKGVPSKYLKLSKGEIAPRRRMMRGPTCNTARAGNAASARPPTFHDLFWVDGLGGLVYS